MFSHQFCPQYNQAISQCNNSIILRDVKAALNRAFDEGKISGDNAWWRVKSFRGCVHEGQY